MSSNSRLTSSPNFRLFFLANSSWTIIEFLSFSPIFLPSLIVNTLLLNKIFLLVLFVASNETTFLNSSDKSSLFIICSPLTTLASFSFANPSYWIIISSTSFNFSISLNWLTLKYSPSFFVIEIEELELSYKAFSISLLDFIIVKQEYKQEKTIVNMIKIIKVLFLFLVMYAIAFFITLLTTPLYFS